jgi:CRP-like cAMP-binding protein
MESVSAPSQAWSRPLSNARGVLRRWSTGDTLALLRNARLRSGWAAQMVTRSNGRRQALQFFLPGDIIRQRLEPGLRNICVALTRVEIEELEPAECSSRDQALLAWQQSMMENQILRLGCLTACERLAHLMLEFSMRLGVTGERSEDSFAMPLTQEMLGDTLGLSEVHVNRVARQLREKKLLEFGRGQARLLDRSALIRMSEFRWPFATSDGEMPAAANAGFMGR